MLTLSIQQPWAWAICYAGKDVENRTWKTGVRGEILIHASKRIDRDGIDYLHMFRVNPPGLYQTGGIVGIAEICDCVDHYDSKWFFGPYGFVLRNQRPVKFMPCKGQLGFFDVNYKG
jgi:hypothetical protein